MPAAKGSARTPLGPIPKIMATFVSACSQGQHTHSARTNYMYQIHTLRYKKVPAITEQELILAWSHNINKQKINGLDANRKHVAIRLSDVPCCSGNTSRPACSSSSSLHHPSVTSSCEETQILSLSVSMVECTHLHVSFYVYVLFSFRLLRYRIKLKKFPPY